MLQRLSKRKDVTLILYTCSHPHEIVEYLKFFEDNEIHFKYVNENLDCPNTAFGCFDKKFYYNIMLEDKAGFDASEDWDEIDEALNEIDNAFVIEIEKVGKPTFWYKDEVGKQFIVKNDSEHPTFYWSVEQDGEYSRGYLKEDCKVINKMDLTLNKK